MSYIKEIKKRGFKKEVKIVFALIVIVFVLLVIIGFKSYLSGKSINDDKQNINENTENNNIPIDEGKLIREEEGGVKIYDQGNGLYQAVIPMASSVVKNKPHEIKEMRTYDSQTIDNMDGTYTTTIGGGGMFFYDGDSYEDLNLISQPILEKKDIKVEKYTFKNIFDFGKFKLAQGITPKIVNENLELVDANNLTVALLPRPFSTDANGDVSLGEYVIDTKEIKNSYINSKNTGITDRINKLIGFNLIDNNDIEENDNYYNLDDNKNNGNDLDNEDNIKGSNIGSYDRILNLKVKVDKEWLKTAKYPVVVDPTSVVLNNVSLVYSGYVRKNFYELRIITSQIQMLGNHSTDGVFGNPPSSNIDRAFLEFNTSSIPSNSLISDVVLNLSFTNPYYANFTVNITRFNNTRINDTNTYPSNSSGNLKLFADIEANSSSTVGGGFYLTSLTNFNFTRNILLDLGSSADADLQNQSGTNGYFSVGFISNNEKNVSCGTVDTLNFGCYMTDVFPYNSSLLIVTYQARRNATVWPELMGGVTASGFLFPQVNWAVVVGVTHVITSDIPIRDHITFPLTNVSVNSTILNATLFYYINSTDYSINEGVEFRKIDEIVNLNSSLPHIFYNITRTGLGRSYGLANGTDVSTTGWKNISLNSNFITDLQNNLNQINGSISIGLNGSNETINYGSHEVRIDYTNSQKPYLVIEYYEGNGSAVTYNAGFDGTVNSDGTATTSSSTLIIGKPADDLDPMPIEVGFMSFITSSINDSSSIQRVFLRINTTFYPIATTHDYNISRLNDSCIDSNSVKTTVRGQEVYNNVTKNIVYKRVSSPHVGFIDIDLGSNATIDLQGKLSSNCFSLGLYDSRPVQGEQISISSMEGNFPPELHVVFEGSFNDNVNCIVPPFGDWSCNATCIFVNKEIDVPENIHAYDSCNLGLAGTTNMSFYRTNSSLFIYKDGMIWINDSAGFNKK